MVMHFKTMPYCPCSPCPLCHPVSAACCHAELSGGRLPQAPSSPDGRVTSRALAPHSVALSNGQLLPFAKKIYQGDKSWQRTKWLVVSAPESPCHRRKRN